MTQGDFNAKELWLINAVFSGSKDLMTATELRAEADRLFPDMQTRYESSGKIVAAAPESKKLSPAAKAFVDGHISNMRARLMSSDTDGDTNES